MYSNQFHFICFLCLFLRSFRSLRFRAFHHRLDEQISAINSIALFRFVINIADLNCESCKISKVNRLIVTKSTKRFFFQNCDRGKRFEHLFAITEFKSIETIVYDRCWIWDFCRPGRWNYSTIKLKMLDITWHLSLPDNRREVWQVMTGGGMTMGVFHSSNKAKYIIAFKKNPRKFK